MGADIRYLLFILWLCYLIVSSILLFTRGFLLSRTVQKENSTCFSYDDLQCEDSGLLEDTFCFANQNLSSILTNYDTASKVCLPKRGRVILLIVDALRHDFTVFDKSNTNPLPFQNKLPVLDHLIKKHPEQTRLYKFIADPPTTTMQRLKALTTGSLPTFIDAGSNFATSEIEEDNLVDQLLAHDKKVVFMGDDTWTNLYPNRFVRNYPYPSFNVWDLDTVDNGVREKLYPELNKTDWSLLIGHFLGVDHCGHRYGPNHPEMARKLGEINSVIEKVVQQMHEDMVLFVIGDHGMTATGDHGGESPDEVTAGMFVYSSQPLSRMMHEQADSVKQIDLIPTLATILGIPIPFQNLGILIPNCLPQKSIGVESWKASLFSLWSNAQQMVHYIKEYSQKEGTFSKESLESFYQEYAALSNKVHSIENQHEFMQFAEELERFLKDLREMCEKVWIQFEPFSMARGLLFLFLSVFCVFLITDGIPIDALPEIIVSPYLTCSYIVCILAAAFSGVLYFLEVTDNWLASMFFCTCLVSQAMLAVPIIQNWEDICLNWYSKSKSERLMNLVCRLMLVLNICGVFSNSYIIEESFVLLFLSVTIIVVCTLGIISPKLKIESRKKGYMAKFFKWSKLKFILLAVTIAALVRASMYFWRCREEQQWCFATHYDVSRITAKMETTKLQWAITVICLAVFVFSTKEWLKNCGNLNGYSFTVSLYKFVPTVLVVCIAGYWVLRRSPSSRRMNMKSTNILVWAIYSLITCGIGSCILSPICTYIIPGKELAPNKENLIPKLFNKIKGSLTEKEEDIPVICGLGTVYSSVFVMIGTYLTLLFALLLGDAVAPAAVIMFLTAAFVLIITSVIRIEKADSMDQLFDVPNISILIWIIMSQYFFYGTGHQPTFPNISWEAAFVGTTGIFSNNIIPGTLIIINTFCSQIVMGVLLPLVLIAPFMVFVMIPSVMGKKMEFQSAAARGEVVLFENDTLMVSSMFVLACKYILGHAIRVFASMISATIHCRHLMVWNIFAPKLIFESIGMLVTLASVVSGYLILIRINKKVERLIIILNKMS
nr:unnamed protein product [Callosobruchus analis]